MAHLIEVAFRGNRKEFFQWTGETPPPLKAGVIVEADRGEDFGRVHATGELAETRCRGCAHGCGTTPPPRAALRLASPEEAQRDLELTDENESTRRKAMERVKANGLVMKLTDAEWQWDRRKLTIFFTAERRVDFRGLVRDLAAQFRTRIELKQIGVRDEARRLGGIGRCGREYCSASWLPDLRPVNLGVAKDQKLSLNPQQISGACGRLMCCLRYEHEFYVASRRRFPKEGKILRTSVGEEKVISCDIFNERVTLRSSEGDTRVVPLADLRGEIDGFGDTGAGVADRTSDRTSDRTALLAAPAEDEMVEVIGEGSPLLAPAIPVEAVGAPVAPTVSAAAEPASEAAVLVESAHDAGDTDAADAADADAADADAAGEPRRKRRRGRRGGRRLRAAEQRRGTPAEGESAGHDTDDADTDDGEDDLPNDAGRLTTHD